MQELIKIDQNADGIKTCNARELHEFLESKRKYADWIKQRIEKYGFIENGDFTIHKFVNGKATQIDYYISIDMAKELAMVENNDKGRQARRYFIACEKELKKTQETKMLPKDYINALKRLVESEEAKQQLRDHNELLQRSNDNAKPKVDFYDRVIDNKKTFSINDAAKLINERITPGKRLGRNGLFSFLRSQDILMDNNTPYQIYIDRGLFCVKQVYKKEYPFIVTHVTNKGIAYIIKKIEKQNNVLDSWLD